MKLKFVRIRNNHFIALPESQFYGLLLVKNKFSEKQMVKLEPLFKYMFYDFEGHSVVVKDNQYFKSMNRTVILKGPIHNFNQHIRTAVDSSSDDDDDSTYYSSDNDSHGTDDDLYERYVDEPIEEDIVGVAVGSNISCTTIFSFLLLNGFAASLALNGMSAFWSRWTEDGGILPGMGAVSAFFGEPIEQHYVPERIIWSDIPEYNQQLDIIFNDIEHLKEDDDILYKYSSEELIKIYGDYTLIDDKDRELIIYKVNNIISSKMSDFNRPLDEKIKLIKTVEAYGKNNLASMKMNKYMMNYKNVFLHWRPYDILTGGTNFLLYLLDYEDFEAISMLIYNTMVQGFENALAIFIANIPDFIYESGDLLNEYLTKFVDNFIPPIMLRFTRSKFANLRQRGNTLINSLSEQMKKLKDLIRLKYNDRKNKMRPAIDRTSRAVALFISSSIGITTQLVSIIYKIINPDKSLALDAITLVNLGLMMHMSGLETIAMSGVFSGNTNYNNIRTNTIYNYYYSITSIQIASNFVFMQFYGIGNSDILLRMIYIHDTLIALSTRDIDDESMIYKSLPLALAVIYSGDWMLKKIRVITGRAMRPIVYMIDRMP